MQSSLPRYTRLVRNVMASFALAVLVTTGCQQGSDEPESTGSGAPPQPIAGSSTDERPNDVETARGETASGRISRGDPEPAGERG